MRIPPWLLVTVLCAACPSPRRHAFDVVAVPGPVAVRLALPHGEEEVALRHALFIEHAAPPGAREAAIEALEQWGGGSVDALPSTDFPLLRDHAGRLLVGLEVEREDEERRTRRVDLGAALIQDGRVWFDAQLLDESAAGPARAEVVARAARRGVFGGTTPPVDDAPPAPPPEGPIDVDLARTADAGRVTVAVDAARAEAALARAVDLVTRHTGATLDLTPSIRVADIATITSEVSRDEGRELSIPWAGAVALSDGRILVRPELTITSELTPEDVLTLMMVHEVVHVVQHARGWLREGPTRALDMSAALSFHEGHAEYWTARVAEAAGLGAAYREKPYALPHYTHGLGAWRFIYDVLAAHGEPITLQVGRSALVDRVHGTLMKGEDDFITREEFLPPDAFLAERVEGWPAPPWTVHAEELVQAGQRVVVWRVRCAPGARSVWFRGTPQVQFERLDGDRFLRKGVTTGSIESAVLRPGEEYAFRLRADDGPGRWQYRFVLKGFVVEFDGARAVHHGALGSDWIGVDWR